MFPDDRAESAFVYKGKTRVRAEAKNFVSWRQQSYALAKALPAISISSAVLMCALEALYATPLRPFH